jgi:hypothetical protein
MRSKRDENNFKGEIEDLENESLETDPEELFDGLDATSEI